MLPDRRMRQIRRQIRNLSQLDNIIKQVKPLDVYHSIAYYCNPSAVSFNDFRGKKPGFQQADNLVLGGDLVFDIDAGEKGLGAAKKDALTCRDWLLEKGYSPITVFSGRGFHLRVSGHDLELTKEKPSDRLIEYRKLREPLIQEIRLLGVCPDAEVTLSPKSIIRLIGSTNSKTGTVAEVVDLDRFDVERVSASATPSPATHQGNDVKKRMEYQASQTGPRLPEQVDAPTQSLFLGTQVFGTKNRQVILIRFPFGTPIELIKSRLDHFLRASHLAPFVLLKSLCQDHSFYALSPSAVENEHIPRLLRDFPEAKANYARFLTRHMPLPVRYVCEIGNWTQADKRLPLSRAHTNILKKMFGARAEGVICGNSHLRVGISEYGGNILNMP
jgi:DNA primase catalytic subunit